MISLKIKPEIEKAELISQAAPFENAPSYKGAGVYAIVNKRNAKMYIGSSSNIKRRHHDHLSSLKTHTHRVPYLQFDYDNGDIFGFTLIDKLDKPGNRRALIKRLLSQETISIMQYNSYVPSLGYNRRVTNFLPVILEFCAALNCQPGDLMEYIPDKDEEKE